MRLARRRRPAGVQLGQLEQVIEQAIEGHHVSAHGGHVAPRLGRVTHQPVVQRLDADADGRQRRAQVVGSPGDEVAAQRLRLAPSVGRGLKLVGHGVERLAQAGHLVAPGDGHARRHIAGRQAVGGGGRLVQPFGQPGSHKQTVGGGDDGREEQQDAAEGQVVGIEEHLPLEQPHRQ